MKKFIIILFILLSVLSLLYIYRLHLVDKESINEQVISQDQIIFEEGYHYLNKKQYNEALQYYLSIQNQLSEQLYLEKNSQLIIILKRLQSAITLYNQEQELLEKVQNYNQTFLEPLYQSLQEVYDFYDLSMRVILEEEKDEEDQFINLYLTNKNKFNNILKEIKKHDSPFMTEEQKEFFYFSLYYSILPTAIYYKVFYLLEGITDEEAEEVEYAWQNWGDYYHRVIDYYNNFDESLNRLEEDLNNLKEGYFELKKQLSLLLPELKLELVL